MSEDVKARRSGAVREETRWMLEELRRRLAEARDGGEAALKLAPEDLRSLCSRAGVEGDAAAAFRLLVRSNLVRLRGRWREGVSGETAPVYVVRVLDGGR